jgi:hypothetical protein
MAGVQSLRHVLSDGCSRTGSGRVLYMSVSRAWIDMQGGVVSSAREEQCLSIIGSE